MLYRLYIFLRDAIRKSPLLHFYVWKLRKAVWRLQNLGEPRRPLVDAGPLLVAAIRSAQPLAAGKIGVGELRGLTHFLGRGQEVQNKQAPTPYPRYIAETLFLNTGVFPQQDDVFDKFGALFSDAVKEMDVLVSWDLQGEFRIFNSLARAAKLVPRTSLDAFMSNEPWTSALAGKRVLVVSPFTETIQRQYPRRKELWRDPRVLPEFTLLAVRCPLSAGIAPPTHPDWITALADLKAQMDALDYDVVLVGAGAFSLPLVAHARRRGKVGVHLGGTLQVLFGVYGGRWKDNKDFQRFINENWVRPNQNETPPTVHKIENACYW
jgi:hypothetical protein